MSWHFHRWSNWEDIKIAEKATHPPFAPAFLVREVIVQQRRCHVCNMVKTRSS